jgi:carbon-monoxide dehydrogenase small subunit
VTYEISLTVNGQTERASVPASMTLLELLRDQLHLTGTKEGCGIGECGACTVLLDGLPVTACLVLAVEADGCEVGTIEGEADDGCLSTLQQAFIDAGAVQCGFCTPGMIVSARALLERCPNPSDEEIVEAIAGNLCRCTGYQGVLDAVRLAANRAASSRPAAGPGVEREASDGGRLLASGDPTKGASDG